MSTELEKFLTDEVLLGDLYYIASPYTDPDPKVREQRVADVAKAVKHMTLNWKHVVPFSPVLHILKLLRAEMSDVPEGWYLSFLKKSDVLMILELEGWESSERIAIAKAFATAREIRIVRYTLEGILSDDDIPF